MVCPDPVCAVCDWSCWLQTVAVFLWQLWEPFSAFHSSCWESCHGGIPWFLDIYYNLTGMLKWGSCLLLACIMLRMQIQANLLNPRIVSQESNCLTWSIWYDPNIPSCLLTATVLHGFLLKLMLDTCNNTDVTLKVCMLGQHDCKVVRINLMLHALCNSWLP